MKLAIKSLAVLIILCNSAIGSELYSDLLRQAAERNGYLTPELTNAPFNVNKSKIGRKIFESTSLSFNSDTSCQSCHLKEFSSADGLPNAIGVGGSGTGIKRVMSGGLIVPRNTLPLWGRGSKDFHTFFWDGKVQTINGKVFSQFGSKPPRNNALLTAIHLPFVEIREMVLDDAEVDNNYKTETVESAENILDLLTKRLKQLNLGIELANAYNKDISEIEFIDAADAVSEHIKDHFKLQNTRFSNFISETGTLTDNEIKGGLLFYGKGKCSTCHSGPHFTDFKFHNIVFPQLGFGKNGFGIDYGRFNVTRDYQDLYKFRTPPLANIAKTAPYGHSGSLATLKSVIISHFDPLRYFDTQSLDPIRRRELFVRIQSTSGQSNPTYLDGQEVNNLAAFLNALSFGD
jgi:cytochrome c peroxidase